VGYNNYTSGFEISSLAVMAAGVTNIRQVGNVVSGYGVEIRGAGNLVLSSTGLLVDSTNLTLIANLGVSGKPCLDLTNQRAYIVHGNTLSSFDTATSLKVGDFSLPFASEDYWYDSRIETCIRWGLDGFAFLDADGSIFLWRWSGNPCLYRCKCRRISDAWEALYFGALNVDPPATMTEMESVISWNICSSLPGQASASPVQVSAVTVGNQMAIRLVFPALGSSPMSYEYMISSDLTQWTAAPDVSETVLSHANDGWSAGRDSRALIPAPDPVSGFIRLRWNPR
jgi:hypothetical protein